jgi:hypothetical protein
VKFFDGAAMDANDVVGALRETPPRTPRQGSTERFGDHGTIAHHCSDPAERPDPVLQATVWAVQLRDLRPGQARPGLVRSQPHRAFKPTEFTSGTGLQLVRNDDYPGTKALVPSIHVLFQTDGSTRTNSLLAGQVDLA